MEGGSPLWGGGGGWVVIGRPHAAPSQCGIYNTFLQPNLHPRSLQPCRVEAFTPATCTLATCSAALTIPPPHHPHTPPSSAAPPPHPPDSGISGIGRRPRSSQRSICSVSAHGPNRPASQEASPMLCQNDHAQLDKQTPSDYKCDVKPSHLQCISCIDIAARPPQVTHAAKHSHGCPVQCARE